MPNSSVIIFLMLRALYRMICKSSGAGAGAVGYTYQFYPKVKTFQIVFANYCHLYQSTFTQVPM